MELDTGASVSLISEKMWREAFSKVELAKCDMLQKTYNYGRETPCSGSDAGLSDLWGAEGVSSVAGGGWEWSLLLGPKLVD